MVWLAVGSVERIGVTQRRSTKGFYQAIEGFGMRGIPTPSKAHPKRRKPGWMLFGLWLTSVCTCLRVDPLVPGVTAL